MYNLLEHQKTLKQAKVITELTLALDTLLSLFGPFFDRINQRHVKAMDQVLKAAKLAKEWENDVS